MNKDTNIDDILKKPMIYITGEELSLLLEKKLEAFLEQIPKQSDKVFYYGIEGIAKLFGCSTVQASRIKASGDIDKAIYQRERLIVVDGYRALELADKADKQRRAQAKLDNSVQPETEGKEV